MNTYQVVAILILVQFGAVASAAYSPLSNQLLWQKRSGPPQVGCAGMCCSGKNSSCFNLTPMKSSSASDKGRCFCDEGCITMGDCCEDYTSTCQAVDCVVGEWTEYTECSRRCGIGMKSRTRKVLEEPKNGGVSCPTLKETTVCRGQKCKSQRHLGARGRTDSDTARIMPAIYKRYRSYIKYNANMDIRKNLYKKYYAPREVERKGYCATFEITSSRISCSSGALGAQKLSKGSQVCVECQTKAMGGLSSATCIGHGTMEKDTFWTAVNSHGCHGWWRRINEIRECTCNEKDGFIFV